MTLREPISNFNTIDVLVRDALGNITQAASGGSTNSGVTGVPNHAAPLLNKGATFDGLGRVTEELFAFAFTANAPKVTSSYNGAEGFRRQLRYDDQLTTASNPLEMSFTPDGAWRLEKIHWSRTGVGTNQELADYAWVGAMRHSRTVRYGGSTHVANGVESYTYDAFGRLSSIQDLTNLVGGGTPAGQAAQTNWFDYLYDAAGNLKEEKYAKAGGWLGDRFTYDEYHRLKKAYMGVSSALISPNPPTPSADPTGYSSTNTKQLVEYDLDEAQNRLGVTETTSGGPVGFGYQLEDSGLSNRYLQAHDAKPEYDKRGNLIYDGQFYYRYDFLNRLQEVWRVLVEAAGAMQSAPESGDKYIVVDEVPALEESRQDVYEEVDNLLHRVPLEHKNPTFRSRLRSDIPGGVIRVPSATSTATSGGGMPQFFLPAKLELVALYGYDAFNRRVIRAVVNEDTYVTSYDGWREAVEHTLSLQTLQAQPTKQFVYGGRLDEMVAYRRYTGLGWETYYIQHGGQDTAAKLVSESGVVVEQYEYDAYGKATVYHSTWGLAGDGTKSAYGLPHMWKGIRRDPETGLLYMRNRFYSVVTGQFLSSDPIGVWGDAGNMGNEYAYAWNRPKLGADPLGLLLVVIDGSNSRNDVKLQADGRFNSHSRNFYEDYDLKSGETSKKYYAGPTISGNNVPNIIDAVIRGLREDLCRNAHQDINIVGHSRGGLIAIEVARRIKDLKICGRTGWKVNFLGLYDPVDNRLLVGDSSEAIPSNVKTAAVVYGNPELGSRWYFNTIDGGVEDPSATLMLAHTVWATHAGIGGDPWGGDHPTYPPNMTEGDTGYYSKYKDWKNVNGNNAKFGRDDDVVGSKLSDMIVRSYAVGIGGIRLRGLTH